METVTAFVIALAFTGSDGFDDCWNYYHANKLETHVAMTCTKIDIPRPSAAPLKSLRPKARPADLMEKHDG